MVREPAEQEPTAPRFSRRLAWLSALGLLLGLTALYQALAPGRGGDVETLSRNGKLMVVLQRGRSGHFSAKGLVNGQPVDFLIDTGATDVAVSQSVARRLGLEFGPRITVMTAAGPAPGWLTRLDQVSIGGIGLTRVRATITPGLGEQALLGMSFLKHFTLRQEGDRLEIDAGPKP